MKASRAVLFAGGSAVLLGAGWVASPKLVPTLDLADPAPAPSDQTDGDLVAYDGPVVATQRGPVQIQVLVSGDTIVGVNGLVMGSPHPNTLRIVSAAFPVLRERVLEAQTWDVEYASGASFFSPGFSESVRGALELAGFVTGTAPVQQPGEAPDQSADYSRPGPTGEPVLPAWTGGNGLGGLPEGGGSDDDADEASAVSGTFDGPGISNIKGVYQARIVVEDGVVVDVRALEAGTSAAQSVNVNAFAIPALRERVLEAQDWDVEHVSGASFTSPAFIESLREAFDDAGL